MGSETAIKTTSAFLGHALYAQIHPLLLIASFAVTGCLDGGDTYTLYRNSVLVHSMRIHVATFDADDKGAYNQENCRLAQDLFQAQEGVTTRFWCEKGRSRN